MQCSVNMEWYITHGIEAYGIHCFCKLMPAWGQIVVRATTLVDHTASLSVQWECKDPLELSSNLDDAFVLSAPCPVLH